MERIITLEKADNVRDLGGYPTQDNRRVKFNKVVRSAAISDLSSQDQNRLGEYGIKTVVDFRSLHETEAKPDSKIPNSRNVFLPIFATDQTKVSISQFDLFQQVQNGLDAGEQMRKVYRHFVEEESARKAYRHFFYILLANEEPEKSVLFHCTAGKDRTGFGAALILSLLNVDRQRIMENYLETNQYMREQTARMVKEAAKQGAPASLQKAIGDLMKADRSYLNESFQTIDELFGGMTGFLKEGLQITASEQQLFQAIYSEEG